MGRRSLTDVSMVTAVDFDFGGITFRLLVLDGLVVLDVCSTFLICGDPAATVMVNGEDSLAACAEVEGCSLEFTRLLFPGEFLDVLGVLDVLCVLDVLEVLGVCFTSLICGESAATVMVDGKDTKLWFPNRIKGCPLTKSAQGNLPSSTHSLVFLESQI